ncbi:hypothetical protein M911_09345 [Ectothiorhodospira haloalkaliphila]|uniref:Uncharacterized protein n=1 Tax=Ectothiorhodospira haloalkaliphila TaxID=421628 RepID=W8KUR9_9GAMM|nr:hypothetical protein [Ectothiorhodospira haloalkaliphila]AHK79316.1 hypothetical protein M911_09345 [Ectothiorhodospira haloalkaliphila]
MAPRTEAPPLDAILDEMPAGSRELWSHLEQEFPIPPDARGLFPIAENVLELKENIECLANQADEDFSHLIAWAEAVGCIPLESELRQLPALTRIRESSGAFKSPLHGYNGTYPVWCALWWRHQLDPHSSHIPGIYKWLQAHMVVAHILLRRNEVHISKDRKPGWKDSARRIRCWHEARYDWVFDYLAGDISKPEYLIGALDELTEWLNPADHDPRRMGSMQSSDVLGQRHGIPEFKNNIAFAHGLMRPPEFEGGKKLNKNKGKRGPRRIQHYIYPDHSYYQVLSEYGATEVSWGGRMGQIKLNRPDEKIQTELKEAGLDPDEYDDLSNVELDIGYLLGEEDRDISSESEPLPPLSTIFANARAKARHVAMHAQRLSVERRRIRLSEIRLIMSVLEELFHESDRSFRLTALLGAVSLVTGTAYQSVCSMVVLRSLTRHEKVRHLAFNPDHDMWIRSLFYAPIRAPMGQEMSGKQAVEMSPRVVFPDVWGVSDHLKNEFVQELIEFSINPRARIQPFRSKSWRPAAYLRKWDEKIAERMALAGLERRWQKIDNMGDVLPSWFAGLEEGAHLENRLLFDRPDPMAQTHAYYTAFQRAELAGYYANELGGLAERLDLPSRDSNTHALFASKASCVTIDESWVGNDRAPRVEHLKAFMERVRAKAPQVGSPYHRRDMSRLCEQHNWRTLYVGLALALGTGFRSVRTPVTDLTAVHEASQTMLLAEKDQWDGRHTRLVVLPEALVTLVKAYRRHLSQLFLQFPVSFPLLLKVPATKNRDRSRYGSAGFHLDLRRTLFFLAWQERGRWHPEEFTGATLKKHCDAIEPDAWPVANAGRHFLRTYLTHQGVAATAINAQMGHWSYGEEPWTPHSAFDPVQFRNEVRPALDALMEQLGFDGRLP